MDYYKAALACRDETVACRREIHKYAEAGLDCPRTRALIMDKLRQYGLDPRQCGHGVTAVVGKGEKCILLRADMDALPIQEESGEPFASQNGQAHACGHDLHTAMLLTAAKLLKENEDSLNGRVKFMFQPGEEIFQGARDMLDHGILSDPAPDAALAFHVTAGKTPAGTCMYNHSGTLMASADGFRITVRGIGAHGAHPDKGVDPINIAVHIYLALEALIAREANPNAMCVMTVGSIHSGSAPNIIPETAVMEGTIRTKNRITRAQLVRRMKEVAQGTAQVYGGSAEVTMLYEIPALLCEPVLTRQMVSYLGQLQIPGWKPCSGVSSSGSEDFALVAEKIPSTMMYLSAGFPDVVENYPAHNPKVRFHEDVCPIGAAAYAHCAAAWLAEHG